LSVKRGKTAARGRNNPSALSLTHKAPGEAPQPLTLKSPGVEPRLL
jgi:hypothetical protein